MKRISRKILVAALTALIIGLLTACSTGTSSIEKVTVSDHESNGVSVKGYTVWLKDTVDWAALSEGDREKIAVAGFEEAQKKITEDGARNYSIVGILSDNAVFLYDGENQEMVIWLDKERVGSVGVTVPEE